MGGRFGEMSTLMNYKFQSFNFRGREKAKPYYDLISNICAEEYGHIELVAATINGMLTGASDASQVHGQVGLPLKDAKDKRLSHHFIVSGRGRARGQLARPAVAGRLRLLHRTLYRFSPDDYRDIDKIWKGPHPGDGQEITIADGPPKGAAPPDTPEQPGIGVPGYDIGELAQMAQRLLRS